MNRDTEVIQVLRFPLAILVVFIHSYIAVEGFHISQVHYFELTGRDVYSLICISFSHVLAQVAVPLFFFISGYLFFLKYQQWSWLKWREKLKRRLSTLLVPYITWITIAALITILSYIAAYLLKGKPLSRIGEWYDMIGGVLGIYWYDISHIESFTNIFGWESFMTYPYLMPMWFIRDLMIVVLLTPIIWFLLKRIPYIVLFLLGSFWALGAGTKMPGISLASLFMFSLGGAFSIRGKSFVKILGLINKWLIISLFAILFVASVCLDGRETQIGQICLHFWILSAIPLFVQCSNNVIKKRKPFSDKVAALADSSFFVFAFHGIIISYIYNLLWTILGISTNGNRICGLYIDANPMMGVLSHFLTPIITITLSLVVFRILKLYLPHKVMKLLNGK